MGGGEISRCLDGGCGGLPFLFLPLPETDVMIGVIVPTHEAGNIAHESESFFASIFHSIVSGFPLYGLSIPWVILIAIGLMVILVVWNLVGKGKGSHAGREEVRRQYRRSLAREMAKQDAEAIKEGRKVRRWWYKW